MGAGPIPPGAGPKNPRSAPAPGCLAAKRRRPASPQEPTSKENPAEHLCLFIFPVPGEAPRQSHAIGPHGESAKHATECVSRKPENSRRCPSRAAWGNLCPRIGTKKIEIHLPEHIHLKAREEGTPRNPCAWQATCLRLDTQTYHGNFSPFLMISRPALGLQELGTTSR